MNRITKFTVLGVLATAIVLGLTLIPPADAQGVPPRIVQLTGGPGFDDAKGRVIIVGESENATFAPLIAITLSVVHLRCRGLFRVPGGLSVASRQFYALYLTTPSLQDRIRVISFNTHCAGGDFRTDPFVPPDLPLFTEDLTAEIFLEVDDGQDGPDSPNILAMSGTDPIN